MMKKFDDELPVRKFDNFQFVSLNATLAAARKEKVNEKVCQLNWAHIRLHISIIQVSSQSFYIGSLCLRGTYGDSRAVSVN